MLQRKKREKAREEVGNYGQGKKKRKENQEKKKVGGKGTARQKAAKGNQNIFDDLQQEGKKTVVQRYCLLFLNTKRNWAAAPAASCMPW